MHVMGVNLWAVLVCALVDMVAGVRVVFTGAVCQTVDHFDGIRS